MPRWRWRSARAGPNAMRWRSPPPRPRSNAWAAPACSAHPGGRRSNAGCRAACRMSTRPARQSRYETPTLTAFAASRGGASAASGGRAPLTMKIVILGAGRVGESAAESLVLERNDITVIDTDPARLRALQERLDLRTVVGNGIQPSVLRDAGTEDADMLIACAAQDDTNLVVCKIPHDMFNVPTTVARLRSPEFE